LLLYHLLLELIALAKTDRKLRVQAILAGIVLLAAVLYGGATLWAAIFPSAKSTWPLRGTVAFKRQSIAAGEIFFDPPAGAGQARSAFITDGTFALSAEEGLLRGLTYVVRVHDYRKTGKKYENGDMHLSAEIVEQYLPSQYSTESQLRFETSAANLRAELTLQLD
jgi:hypothetical protein